MGIQGEMKWLLPYIQIYGVEAYQRSSIVVSHLFELLQRALEIEGRRYHLHNCRRSGATTPLANDRSPFVAFKLWHV